MNLNLNLNLGAELRLFVDQRAPNQNLTRRDNPLFLLLWLRFQGCPRLRGSSSTSPHL